MTTQHTSLKSMLREGGAIAVRFAKARTGSFVLAVVGAALFVAAIVASAIVIGWVTDELIVPVLDGGESYEDLLWPAMWAVVAVALWKAAAVILRRTAASFLQFRVQADARHDLIEHMLKLELAWYQRQSTGTLLAVSDTDVRQGTFILAPLPYGIGSSLLLVGTVVLILILDPWLALLAFFCLGVIVAVNMNGAWRMFNAFRDVQSLRGEVSGIAHESFDGALTIKALGRIDFETARFQEASERLRDKLIYVLEMMATYRVGVEGLLSAVTVIMVIAGALRINSGAVTPGDIVTIAYLLSLLFIPIRIIGFVLWSIASSRAGWERVQDVYDVRDLVPYGDLLADSDDTGAHVSGSTVSFAYDEGGAVIEDLNLAIKPGRVVAIVGPTASGKSTLTALMARLWDPSTGSVSIDGRDLRSFARSALPGEVAYVSQESFLFDDTVTGNIAFGVLASEGDVVAAAKLAGAHEFIQELPEEYDTTLGERGTSLSGGQRQRIALARALVRKPRLLILDDATSAVDPSVEARILERLRDSEMPSTIVIVAYRTSSIALADEVVFIDDGKIVAHGTHHELTAGVPGYARIVEAYAEDAAERAEEGRGA
ncbi:MAG: ABC transporter ATP-binding protein [Acidimicrobiia bacterium]|nr:ABC transporter ATP-binding protein [Acidimicrobiia bacterium]